MTSAPKLNNAETLILSPHVITPAESLHQPVLCKWFNIPLFIYLFIVVVFNLGMLVQQTPSMFSALSKKKKYQWSRKKKSTTCTIFPRYNLNLELVLCKQTLKKEKVSSLSSLIKYKYGISKCEFLHDDLSVQLSSGVYRNTKNFTEVFALLRAWRQVERQCSTRRSPLPRDTNQVCWTLGSLMSFAVSLPTLMVLHSVKMRVKIVCDNAYPTLRPSSCAWYRMIRTGFPSKRAVGKQDLSGVEILQNIGCNKRSKNCLSPDVLCHLGLALSICYLHCYTEPQSLPPLSSILSCWPHAACQAAPCSQLLFGSLALPPSCLPCTARAGTDSSWKAGDLPKIARPPGMEGLVRQPVF